MNNITYTSTDERDIDVLAPLWLKLIAHHRERSPRFREHFDTFTWEERRRGLLEKASGGYMRIDLAYDGVSLIGYCVSTVNARKHAEIESIYIEEYCRRVGIGTRFMEGALTWMQERGSIKREVGVAAGNEEALPFYARFGFYPRVIVLEQAREN